MWRWGTPQNFCLTFIDELEKQLLKKLLKWASKKSKNINIYVVFKKIKQRKTPGDITLQLCTKTLDMIYSS